MKFSVALAAVVAAVFAMQTQVEAASSGTLSLTTYNIHGAVPDGKSGMSYWPQISDLGNVADVLTTAGADIIALQEVRNMWSDPPNAKPDQYPINMPQYLATLLKMDYAFGSGLDFVPRFRENRDYLEWGSWDNWTNNGARHGEYGNAILSKYPLETPPQLIKLPRGTDEEAQKLGDEPRLALRAELKDPIPGLGRVIVYATHFQHNNEKTRRKQIRKLVERATKDLQPTSADTTATVFLMGDFNHNPMPGKDPFLAVPAQAGFHDLAADFAKDTGTTPHHTASFKNKPIRIDYIFCSRPVKVLDVKVLETTVSDHLPLTVTVEAK
jgi:endonuclease/exonuclease/phosphatase family metal-dependent hydrolase